MDNPKDDSSDTCGRVESAFPMFTLFSFKNSVSCVTKSWEYIVFLVESLIKRSLENVYVGVLCCNGFYTLRGCYEVHEADVGIPVSL